MRRPDLVGAAVVRGGPSVGTAVSRHPDPGTPGTRAVFDVISVRGFGHQRRVLLRYRGHQDAAGTLTRDPDATFSAAYPVWASAARYTVTLNRRASPLPRRA